MNPSLSQLNLAWCTSLIMLFIFLVFLNFYSPVITRLILRRNQEISWRSSWGLAGIISLKFQFQFNWRRKITATLSHPLPQPGLSHNAERLGMRLNPFQKSGAGDKYPNTQLPPFKKLCLLHPFNETKNPVYLPMANRVLLISRTGHRAWIDSGLICSHFCERLTL